jgi:hypothetical protein
LIIEKKPPVVIGVIINQTPSLPVPSNEEIPTIVQKENTMKLTPPKVITFWISVVLGVLGLIGQVGIVAALTPYAFWFAFAGLVLLVLALLVKGL